MSTVLFLCTANYYRSRFAEILFNHVARRQGLSWAADSRALRPEGNEQNVGPISLFALQGLKERGISSPDLPRWPKPLTQRDLEAADLVVAVKEAEHRPLLAERFPAWEDRVEFWQIDDIDCMAAEQALGELERQVVELVSRLAQQAPRRIPA